LRHRFIFLPQKEILPSDPAVLNVPYSGFGQKEISLMPYLLTVFLATGTR
jgi:hypothetical protein